MAEAGGRALPAWTLDDALSPMDLVGIRTGMMSVSTPEPPWRAIRRGPESPGDVNDLVASLVSD